MDRDLEGRKAIVTGSGKGFGRAISLRLGGGGADVQGMVAARCRPLAGSTSW